MGKIHFIWAGGEKLMPESSIAQMHAWKRCNPAAEIWIWVDQTTLSPAAAEYYGKPPPRGFGADSFYFKDVRDLARLIEEYVSVDPEFSTKMQLLHEIALYEATRLRPNFGASSDIWRYLILFFHSSPGDQWSAYFDHDVAPGEEKIESAFAKTEADLLFSANSQRSNIALNDAFICRAPYSPLLKFFLEKIYVNYTQIPLISSISRSQILPVTRIGIYDSDERERRKDQTILRTGPRVITHSLAALFKAKVLASEGWIMDMPNFCTTITPPTRFAIPLSVCPGSTNAGAWITPLAQPRQSYEFARADAVESIRFEARVMGIIRLDDHVKDIVDSLYAGKLKEMGLRAPGVASGDIAIGGAGGGAAAAAAAAASVEAAPDVLGAEFKSTTTTPPTVFEHYVARGLVAALGELDSGWIRCRPYISRYPTIRDYYESHFPSISDGSDTGMNAAQMFMNLVDKRLTVRMPPEELQAIVDSWIPKVIPFLKHSFSEMTEGSLVSDEDLGDRPGFLLSYLNGILALQHEQAKYEITIPLSKDELALIASCLPKLEAYIKASDKMATAASLAEGEVGGAAKDGAGGAAKGSTGCTVM